MGKPDGCLRKLRSVHIDRREELNGDETANHGPIYPVAGPLWGLMLYLAQHPAACV